MKSPSSLLSHYSILIFLLIDKSVYSVPADLRSVEVGGCVDVDNKVVYCAAVKEECEDIENVQWKTSQQLKQLHDLDCTSSDIPLGKCKSTNKCAITKDSCEDPTDFDPPSNDNNCNVEGLMLDDAIVPTQYGGCKDGTTNEIVCVISPDDCLYTEAWITPSVVEAELIGGCRCHDVRVGLCRGTFEYNRNTYACAISTDDCVLTYEFESARDVLDQPFRDCRLCPYDENLVGTGEPVGSSDESVDESIEVTKMSEDESIKPIDESIKPIEAKSGLSRGSIVGIIVGTLSSLLLIVALVFFYNRKSPSDDPSKTKQISEINAQSDNAVC